MTRGKTHRKRTVRLDNHELDNGPRSAGGGCCSQIKPAKNKTQSSIEHARVTV